MTAMEAQKQAKDSENKENLTESGSCVYCATNTVGFVPGSLLFPSHCWFSSKQDVLAA